MADRKIEIVDYKPEHGEYIAANIRQIDRKEIYYFGTLQPLPAIRMTAANAVAAWTVLVDDVPAMMFGINRRSHLSQVGVPWLLATDEVEKHPMRFAYASKVYFDRMVRAFPKMENHVLAENKVTIRWLKWLGFDMEEPAPFGAFQAHFRRFGKELD